MLKNYEKYPMLVIGGATATGKTNVAVETAKRIGGEIVSADSMQVYKLMDIGTAKPTAAEMQGIPHYMIDELYPNEEFNVAVFKNRANIYLEKIWKRGKIPIIAGGTGFYINALTRQTEFSPNTADSEIRNYYERLAEEKGERHLYELLAKLDPLTAEALHPNNVKRVKRALEYYDITGESITEHNRREKAKTSSTNVSIFVLTMERSTLYERINARVDKMMELGLLCEVESLLSKGYHEGLTSMQGIGYKEIVKHIRGDCSLEEAVDTIKKASRNYAKRQITWFKHQCDGKYLDASVDAETLSRIIERELEQTQNEHR